jgi:methylmalonyl-CoA mutase cobalamin-binding subunit
MSAPEQLVDFCAAHDVDVAVISVTNAEVGPVVHEAVTALGAAGVPVVVGGAGRTIEQLLSEVRAAARPAPDEG